MCFVNEKNFSPIKSQNTGEIRFSLVMLPQTVLFNSRFPLHRKPIFSLLLTIRPRFSYLFTAHGTVTPQMDAADASEETLRGILAEKQASVDAQADAVRKLKAAAAAQVEIEAAVESLKALKIEVSAVAKRLQAVVSSSGGGSGDREAFRQAVLNTLERRLFYIPSFKIYRGVAGLYDYGPPGCAVKSNVLAFWRQVEPLNPSSLSSLRFGNLHMKMI